MDRRRQLAKRTTPAGDADADGADDDVDDEDDDDCGEANEPLNWSQQGAATRPASRRLDRTRGGGGSAETILPIGQQSAARLR